MEGEAAAPGPAEGRGCRRPGRAPEGGAHCRSRPSPALPLRASAFQFLGSAVLGWASLGISGWLWLPPSEQQETKGREKEAAAETTPGETRARKGPLSSRPSLGPDSAGALGGHDRQARLQVSGFSLAPVMWWVGKPPFSRQHSPQPPHPPVSLFASLGFGHPRYATWKVEGREAGWVSGGSGQSNWGKNNWGGSCFHCKAFSLQLHMMVCYYFFLSMLAELLNGFRFQGQVEFFFCEQKKKKKSLCYISYAQR